MNCSYENIFQKYNLRNENPRKRRRRTKSQFCKKDIQISARNSTSFSVPNTKSFHFGTNIHLNNSSKAKYSVPTKYSKLEIIKVRGEVKLQTYSLDNNAHSKENMEKKQSNDHRKICDDFETATVSQVKATPCSLGNNNIKPNNIMNSPKMCDMFLRTNNVHPYEMNETNLITENCFTTKSSAFENTEDITLQSTRNEQSELDLLIDLIEQEGQINKKGYNTRIVKQNGKTFNCDERLLVTKPILRGGYQEMFERCLKDAKVKSNFLKYDKKLGLRVGHLLTVVNMDTFYGLNLATVKSQALNKHFAVVVPREKAPYLKLGSRIEAFFDDNTIPYKLLLNGEYSDVYLEPYKLITY